MTATPAAAPHAPTQTVEIPASRTSRVAILIYGLACYALFLLVFSYLVFFIADLFVPKTINSGAVDPILPSLLINGALLLSFAGQHMIMARPRFKRWWTQVIPVAAERSTFVLATCLCLIAMAVFWQPLPMIVWEVEASAWRYVIMAVSALGWLIVLLSTFMINHFDLFGLRQVMLNFLGRPYKHVGFRLVGFYRFVRHPLMVGFLVAFWATPTMTIGHLFFASVITLYILIGTAVEERDLIDFIGEPYLRYRRRVRGLIPVPKRVAA